MSPKIVNGSFVAIFDQGDFMTEYAKNFTKFRLGTPDSPGKFHGYIGFLEAYLKAMRKRIRGILMSGKQFSLDSHLDLVQGIVNHTSQRPVSEPTGEPPLLEDSNETGEDADKENKDKDNQKDNVKDNDGLECQSDDDSIDEKGNFLEAPQPREFRSKSVDNVFPLVFDENSKPQMCQKCGHACIRPVED